MSCQMPATPWSSSSGYWSPHHWRTAGFEKSGKPTIPGQTMALASEPSARVRKYPFSWPSRYSGKSSCLATPGSMMVTPLTPASSRSASRPVRSGNDSSLTVKTRYRSM